MTYSLRLDREAERYLQRLGPKDRARVVRRIDRLLEDPYDSRTSKTLQNAGPRRSSRVGGLRIVFRVYEDDKILRVQRIGPRGQVYRGLE